MHIFAIDTVLDKPLEDVIVKDLRSSGSGGENKGDAEGWNAGRYTGVCMIHD